MESAREDAVMTDTQNKVVLRLLVGVQRGAEMPLSPASYVIGSGEDCDIVLTDESVKAAHAQLTLSDDAVTLSARDGVVFFKEQILKPGEETTLELPVALSLGLVAVGIGAPTTDWAGLPITEPRPVAVTTEEQAPEEDSPDEEAAESSPAKTGAETGAETGTEKGADATADGENAAPAEADTPADTQADAQTDAKAGAQTGAKAEAEGPADAEADKDAAKAGAGRSRRLALIGAGVALPVVIAIVAVALLAQQEPTGGQTVQADTEVSTPQSPQAAAEEVAERLGLSDVRFAPGSDGSVAVSGFVPTAKDRNDLHSALTAAGLTFTDKSRAVDQILDQIRQALSGLSWPEPDFAEHLVVTYKGNGEIDIDGFLGPQVGVGNLGRRLRSDVPGIATLRFTRTSVRDWQQVLNQRIRDAGLSTWLTTRVDGSRIRISGDLTASQAKTWRELGEAFVEESRGWPKLAIAVTASRQPASPAPPQAPAAAPSAAAVGTAGPAGRPDITVIGVVLSDGRPSLALLSTGETLAEGRPLDGVGTVTGIGLDSVTITKGNQEFVYRVKGGR